MGYEELDDMAEASYYEELEFRKKFGPSPDELMAMEHEDDEFEWAFRNGEIYVPGAYFVVREDSQSGSINYYVSREHKFGYLLGEIWKVTAIHNIDELKQIIKEHYKDYGIIHIYNSYGSEIKEVQ